MEEDSSLNIAHSLPEHQKEVVQQFSKSNSSQSSVNRRATDFVTMATDQGKEERDQVAARIWEQRRSERAHRSQIEGEIEARIDAVSESFTHLAELAEEADSLEQTIAVSSGKILSRFFKGSAIDVQRADLQEKKSEYGQQESQIQFDEMGFSYSLERLSQAQRIIDTQKNTQSILTEYYDRKATDTARVVNVLHRLAENQRFINDLTDMHTEIDNGRTTPDITAQEDETLSYILSLPDLVSADEQTQEEIAIEAITHFPELADDTQPKVSDPLVESWQTQTDEIKGKITSVLSDISGGDLELYELSDQLEHMKWSIKSSQNNPQARAEVIEKIKNLKLRRMHSQRELIKLRSRQEVLQQREPKSVPDEPLEDVYKKRLARLDSIRRELLESKRLESQFGTVEKVMQAFDTFFVHAIRSDLRQGQNNNYLRGGVTWDQKLDLFIQLQPSACFSTYSRERKDLWGPMGVIISNGDIQAAMNQDGNTSTAHSRERVSERDLSRVISALTYNKNQYNEFVVSNPQTALFYIDKHFYEHIDKDKVPPLAEIQTELEKRGLPLCILQDGKVYPGRFVDTNGEITMEITSDTPYTAQEMAELKYTPSSEVEEEIIKPGAHNALLMPVNYAPAK